jgi:hypothetical protein
MVLLAVHFHETFTETANIVAIAVGVLTVVVHNSLSLKL